MKYKKDDTLIEKINKRINEINSSFPQRDTSPKFRARFAAKEEAADTLYKHIPDYAKVTFGKNTRAEDYVVNACVWQEYLVETWLKKIKLSNIAPTERKSDLFRKNRAKITETNQDADKIADEKISQEKKSEKLQCKHLIITKNDRMGKLLDFQVPLKARKAEQRVYKPEHKGELDIVARQDNEMVLIEYKIPNSTEPLLRAVLEAITYFHQIDGPNPNESAYLKSFNNTFFENDEPTTWCNAIGLAIVVPEVAFKYGHKCAYELIDVYNIKCYTFRDESNFEDILPLSQKQISEYRNQAEKNLEGIYQNSKLITSKIDLR